MAGNQFEKKKSDRKRSVQTDEVRLWEQMTGDVEPMGNVPERAAPDPGHELNEARRDGVSWTPSSTVGAPVEPINRLKAGAEPGSVSGSTQGLRAGQENGSKKAMPVVLDRRNLRRIGKGRISIDDRIDLHGMRRSQAHQALLVFIRAAQVENFKTVLVITGKGRLRTERSENWMDDREFGVLRREVPEWLRSDELEDVVNGFSNALPQHGGDGALYVRLKRRR